MPIQKWLKQCCGTVTIFYSYSSDFWKVTVPLTASTIEMLWSGSDFGSDYWKVTVSARYSDHKEWFSTKKICYTKSCLFDVNRSSFVDKTQFYTVSVRIFETILLRSGSSWTELQFRLLFRFWQKVTDPTVPVPQNCIKATFTDPYLGISGKGCEIMEDEPLPGSGNFHQGAHLKVIWKYNLNMSLG